MAPPGMLMFTRLSSLYAQRTPERDRAARRLFFSGLDKLLFLSTAMAVFFWVMAEPLLGALYGPSFVAATPALRILVLAALAATTINPYTLRAAGAGRGRPLHPGQRPALRGVPRRAVRADPRHRFPGSRRRPPARPWPGCC